MRDSHVMTLKDGRELGWTEFGEPDGWPVIGFHGTPGSRLQVAIDDAPVRAAGVRLVAPDRPGYGLSTFAPGRRLIDWPADVSQLADHLGLDRFSVMGISGGGPHAVVCAALLPERVHAAAIVSGVGPLSDPAASAEMMKSNQIITALARKRSPLLRVLSIVQVAIARRWPDKTLDLLVKQLPPADVAIFERPAVREVFLREVSRASRTTGHAQAQDFELFASSWGFEFGDVTVPVHLWQGGTDRNVPAQHATLMAERLVDATLHAFPDEGHFLVIDRMEAILTAITPT